MNKRVECTGPLAPFQIVERSIPDTPPKGLVVKNHYSGICHSDVHFWKNEFKFTDDTSLKVNEMNKAAKFPAVFGHEISGEVYSLGNEYEGTLKIGDKVVVHPWIGCCECDACLDHENRGCDRLMENNLGVGAPGGFQQYMSVPEGRYALPAPANIPMEVMCQLSCSALTTYNAVTMLRPAIQSAMDYGGSAKVLIIGAGGLGLWAVQWSKRLLPEGTKVFVADISEDKFEQAKALGADETILWDRNVSDDDLVTLTKEKTGGGINGSIDLVGIPSTFYKAVMSAKKFATCAMIGLCGGLGKIPLVHIIFSQIRINGVVIGNLNHMREQVALMEEKQLQGPKVVLVKPEDTEQCLKNLMAGTFQGRYVIDWTKV